MKKSKKKRNQRIKGPGPKQRATEKTSSFSVPSNFLVYGGLALVLVITLIIRLNFLDIPFERDEGTYAYFGQLVLDGKTAYTDFYEMKPPLIYYSYAFLIAIFGASLSGVHLGVTLLNLATVTFLFFIGKRLLGNLPAIAIAGSYGLLSLALSLSGFTAQSEHILVFYATAGLAAGLKGIEEDKPYWLLGGGILTACSALVKQNGLFFILILGVALIAHYWFRREDRSGRSFIRSLAVLAAGVLLPVILFTAILALQGALSDFAFWVLEYPRGYVGSVTLSQGLELFSATFSRIFSNNPLLWLVAGFGLIVIHFSRPGGYRLVLIWAFLLLSFLSIVPGLRFYPHYWIQWMPAIALLVGCAFYFLEYQIGKNPKSTPLKAIPPVALVFLLLLNLLQNRSYYFQPDYVEILREVYTMNPFPESAVIGDYIRQRTTPEDKIFVLGSEPQIYFYTGRRSPTRHNYLAYVVKSTDIAAQWRDEVVRDIQEDPPKFIVYFSHPVSWSGGTQEALQDLIAKTNSLITSSYKVVGKIDAFGNNNVQYVWGEAANGYQVRSNLFVYIYERI